MTDIQHGDDRNNTERRFARRRAKPFEKSGIRRKRLEKVLTESEQRLHSIIGGSSIPAFMIGKDHRIIYWNKALEQLSRIQAREVVGTNQHWRAFYKKKRLCLADLLLDHQIEDVSRWDRSEYIKSSLLDEAYEATDFFPELCKKGKWLHFTAAIIRDAAGELIGAIETLEDITGRKNTEKSLLKTNEKLERCVKSRIIESGVLSEPYSTASLYPVSGIAEDGDDIAAVLQELKRLEISGARAVAWMLTVAKAISRKPGPDPHMLEPGIGGT